VAGLLLPRDPIVGISDDPAIDAGGGITPTSYNLGIKLTEGSDKQFNQYAYGVLCDISIER
jgi:hypothetical protein